MIKRIRAAFAALFVAGTMFAGAPASAVPAICVMPTTGTVSGLTLVQDINSCLGAALGLFAAGTAPGSPTTGMLWWNTGTGWVQQWDGAAWINLWAVDSTNHLLMPQVGGGNVPGIASAATTDLCGAGDAPMFVNVTGTATINSFGTTCVAGQMKVIVFSGGLTLTNLAGGAGQIVLPTGANITTAANDVAFAIYGGAAWTVAGYQRATGAALSTVGLNVGASALAQSAQGYNAPINLQLSAAVSGNNLTVSLLGVNGSNPSTSNPVLVNFRSQTLNNGSNGVVYGQITSALSFQVTSGNTMGCTTAVLCRLWATLICQTESSGACTSVLLGLSNQSASGQVYPLVEEALQSTGPGTAGGGSAGVIQTSVAGLSGKAIRIAGYVEVTWHSGTGWDTTPSKVQVFGPGVHKPGDVVQTAYVTSATGTTTSSGTPQATNLTATVTPTSAINLIRVDASGSCVMNQANIACQSQLYRGTTALGQVTSINVGGTASTITSGVAFNVLDAPNTTSATTYVVKLNSGNSVNNVSFVPGGMIVEEIMGALEAPPNDAGAVDLPPRALAALQPDRLRQKATA
jgi:hypothetical protein